MHDNVAVSSKKKRLLSKLSGSLTRSNAVCDDSTKRPSKRSTGRSIQVKPGGKAPFSALLSQTWGSPESETIYKKKLEHKGTYGYLYLVEHLGKRYVEKPVPKHCLENSDGTKRRWYERSKDGKNSLENPNVEEFLLRKLNHPNILKILDTVERGDNLVIVLEHAEGGEYLNAVKENRFGPDILRHHFSRVVDAVKFVHDAGWAHLDLSLENILIKESQPKVMDFGMAVPTDARFRDFRGKEMYAAPECWAGRYYDPCKADVWSLGIILFIMLAGKPPFRNTSPRRIQRIVPCEIFKAFSQGKISIVKIVTSWSIQSKFQNGALDLLQLLLQVDPMRRPTLQEVLAHPFCKNA